MKSTDAFKQTIKEYLDKRANEDELFAKSYAKENKNLDECINFILTEVQKSGCNGFGDDEIYGMAVHYYDEDEIKDLKSISGHVVVNHKVELSEEEKAELRIKAENEYKQSVIADIRKKEEDSKAKRIAKQKEAEQKEQQLSLFQDVKDCLDCKHCSKINEPDSYYYECKLHKCQVRVGWTCEDMEG